MPSGVQIAQAFARFQASKRPSFDATTFIGALQQRDPAAARAIETLQDAVNQLSRDLYSLQLEIFPQLIVLGRNGAPISWIGDNPPYGGGWFQELYIGGANPSVSKIIADQNGNVTIDGSVLVFGTVTAAAFNVLAPFVTGLTLQSNTPAAGQITWSACTMYYGGVGYSISGNNTSSKYVYWDVGNSTFTAADSFTPGPNRYVVATNTGGTVDFVLNKLGSGVVQPENLNSKTLIVRGITITNNSPSGGSIAWSACTIVWNGIAYSIAGGNTSLAFVYWDGAASTLTAAASFTPQTDRFLIATNSGGTGNLAWNTLPYQGIQEDNLSFPINSPFQPQVISGATVDLTVLGTTTIINHSGKGALLAIGVRSGTITASAGDQLDIEIQIDGATIQAFTIMKNSNTFDADARNIGADSSGDGATSGDFITFYFHLAYNTSLLVRANVVNDFTGGTVRVSAIRANRI